MADNKQFQTGPINAILSLILKTGAYIGIAFMLAGLALFRGSFQPQSAAMPLSGLRQGIMKGDPLSLITLGLIILILTPVLRVLGAALTFLLVEKDRKYFLISLGVLIILLISISLVNS